MPTSLPTASTKSQKLITRALWSLLLLAMVGVLVGKFIVPKFHTAAPPPDVYGPASAFYLIDENGSAFSSEVLKNKPYIANFMFTKCAGICPRMNAAIAKVQQDLPADMQTVSFTVDPQNDTPGVLKQYASTFHADAARWHFITGDEAKLKEVAAGLKVSSLDWPAGHSDRVILVDAGGQIRGWYRSTEPESMLKLVTDAAAVVRAATIARAAGSNP